RLPGMQILGRICIAKPAPSRNGWQTLFSWSSPTRWLKRAGGMSDREAAEITSRLGLGANDRLGRIGWRHPILLGLEAAWARGADVILFSTSGCDPLTTLKVCEAVAARLDRCAAIRLSYAFFCNGRKQRDCFPGSRCVDFQSSAPPPSVSLERNA